MLLMVLEVIKIINVKLFDGRISYKILKIIYLFLLKFERFKFVKNYLIGVKFNFDL